MASSALGLQPLDGLEQPLAAHLPGGTVTEQVILVEGEYGEGAFGPTILLVLQGVQGVAYLRAIFDRLADSPEGTTVCLNEDPGLSMGAALWALDLQIVPSPPRRHLFRDEEGGFTWVGTSDEWQTTSLMIEPLLHQHGHQYLTSEVEDDALVEVSHGETHGRA